jgi:DNA segregation ATPase FtsK/SpoIIIE, S-DNA-T family
LSELLEFLAIPCVLGALALLPKSANNRKKIDTIFRNDGYGVRGPKDKEPRFPMYKGKESIEDAGKVIAVEYKYKVPLGLPVTLMKFKEEKDKVFSDGLNRPVRLYFDGQLLRVRVYYRGLPERLEYASIPKRKLGWLAPMGMGLDGMIWRDFDAIPHMIIAGTTRFGKTVALKLLMTYLIENHPDDVELYIIDLKGGLEFSRYENLKQVKGFASDEAEALEVLSGLVDIMQHEYVRFRKNRISNIVDTDIKKRRFIIIDEAAQLTPEGWQPRDIRKALEECQSRMSMITRIGGALGFRQIFCTQYPTADTLPRAVKMTSDVKMTFRLGTAYASGVAIDEPGAEELPTDLKGRALYKTHEVSEIQVPYISDDEMYSRLNKYQEVTIWEGEAENVVDYEENGENRGDSSHDSNSGVCDTFAITSRAQFKK